MKAVVFDAFGPADVLRVADIDRPSPGEGEVLVRVRAAAVNPKDTFVRKGRFAALTGSQFPMRSGFDFAGEVAGGGEASAFEKGMPVFGMLDGWHGGTCAQYIAVKPHQLSRKPANLSFEEAAALPLVSLTALQALRDEGRIEHGFRVCVNGAAGGVGSMAVQIAKRYGAAVTAVGSAANHAMLEALGADRCIDYHKEDIVQGGQRFDIFFDVFGNRLFDNVKPILTPGEPGFPRCCGPKWVRPWSGPRIHPAARPSWSSYARTAATWTGSADGPKRDRSSRSSTTSTQCRGLPMPTGSRRASTPAVNWSSPFRDRDLARRKAGAPRQSGHGSTVRKRRGKTRNADLARIKGGSGGWPSWPVLPSCLARQDDRIMISK